jgi:hypothetical protein
MMTKLSDKVSVYKDIVEYCTKQYETDDKSESQSYYGRGKADRRIAVQMLNLLGINYRNYIGNTKLSESLDQWMVLNFFSHILHNSFDLKFCTKAEYYTVMTVILAEYGLNGIDPEKIKKYHADFTTMRYTITQLYDEDYSNKIVSKSKDADEFLAKIPKMDDLRKNLKASIDSVPMLKYIVASGFDRSDVGLNQIPSSNPLKLHQNSYYGVPEWYSNMGGAEKIEELRLALSSIVK